MRGRLAQQGTWPLGPAPLDREVGAALCRHPRTGDLAHGPVATGHLTGVEVELRCPPGYKPWGLVHTHPGGVPVPSELDWETARRFGLKRLCVSVPDTGVTRCYPVPSRRRR